MLATHTHDAFSQALYLRAERLFRFSEFLFHLAFQQQFPQLRRLYLNGRFASSVEVVGLSSLLTQLDELHATDTWLEAAESLPNMFVQLRNFTFQSRARIDATYRLTPEQVGTLWQLAPPSSLAACSLAGTTLLCPLPPIFARECARTAARSHGAASDCGVTEADCFEEPPLAAPGHNATLVSLAQCEPPGFRLSSACTEVLTNDAHDRFCQTACRVHTCPVANATDCGHVLGDAYCLESYAAECPSVMLTDSTELELVCTMQPAATDAALPPPPPRRALPSQFTPTC